MECSQLTRCAKGVTCGKLPHAREELGKTTEEEGHTNDDVGNDNVTGMDIVEGEN